MPILTPPINDISTSPDAAPLFRARKDRGYPAGFAPIQRKAYPDVAPLPFPGLSPAHLYTMIIETVRGRTDWQIVREDATALAVEAVAITRWLRFRDDIVMEARPLASGGSVLQMRSRSRLGRND